MRAENWKTGDQEQESINECKGIHLPTGELKGIARFHSDMSRSTSMPWVDDASNHCLGFGSRLSNLLL